VRAPEKSWTAKLAQRDAHGLVCHPRTFRCGAPLPCRRASARAPMEDHRPRMTGRVGSDAAPTALPWDEPDELEARFEQNDTLSHRTVGALSWMFVNARWTDLPADHRSCGARSARLAGPVRTRRRDGDPDHILGDHLRLRHRRGADPAHAAHRRAHSDRVHPHRVAVDCGLGMHSARRARDCCVLFGCPRSHRSYAWVA